MERETCRGPGTRDSDWDKMLRFKHDITVDISEIVAVDNKTGLNDRITDTYKVMYVQGGEAEISICGFQDTWHIPALC